MIESDIFEQWLDADAKRVVGKLTNHESLTQDDKLTVVIKSLTNHVAHLDVELRSEIKAVNTNVELLSSDMDKRFSEVDKRFGEMQSQFDKRFGEVDKRFE
jgi:hypothetical protein